MHTSARWRQARSCAAVSLLLCLATACGGGSGGGSAADGAVDVRVDVPADAAPSPDARDAGPARDVPADTRPDTGPNTPPVAAFTASAHTGATPLDVTFDAAESHDPDGTIVAWAWDFGDGTTDAGAVVDHTFETVGSFVVTLTVTDDGGATDSATETIVVESGLERTETSGLISGEVWDTDARAPLAGVRVTIPGRPGVAITGEDGRFVAPSPGPGAWQLDIDKPGYTYARRTAAVDASGFAGVDPIYLKRLDPAVTRIGPEGGSHVSADGEVEIDIPAGATATPLDIQATNLDHEDELPAPLPEHTDFTYCVNLEPELATFAAPVTVRVANSLGFPPGTRIPVGIFRRDEGAWRHETLATVTEDGAWVTYETAHFSAHDINFYQWMMSDWTQSPGGSATSLADAPTSPSNRRCKSVAGGSLVDVRDGELTIRHDPPTWRSHDRLRGVRLEYSSRAAAPTAMVGVDYDFVQEDEKWAPAGHTVITRVAGAVARFRFEPMEGPHRFGWLWTPQATGRDAVPTGVYRYVVEVSNDYRVNYWQALEFAGAVIEETGVPGRQLARRQAEFFGLLPLRNLAASPLGAGWAVAGLQRLHRAPDGSVVVREGAVGLTLFEGGLVLEPWPSEEAAGFFEGQAGYPMGLAFLPAGDLVFTASQDAHRVWKLAPDGALTRLAGDGTAASTGDGGPAVDAQLNLPHGLATDAAGNIYVAEMGGRVRRIDPRGIISTVAGTDTVGFSGDGGPATEAQLDWPMDVAVGPEGELYVADAKNGRIRRIAADGTITTFAGGGASDAGGTPALDAYLGAPTGVAVDRQGVVYIACQTGTNRVKRVDRDGMVRNVTPAMAGGVVSVAVGPDDAVYYRVAATSHTWIEKVGADGVRQTVAGARSGEMVAGAVATDVRLAGGFHLAFDPLGRLTIATNHGRVFALRPSASIPGRELSGGPGDFTTLVFDADGGAVRGYPNGATVGFDAAGRQRYAEDRSGNRTTYEWEGAGVARRLARIVGPAGLVNAFRYDDAGRLAAMEDPAGRETIFEVDGRGDLVRIENPDGGERRFGYDAAHRMTERVEPMGETTRYEFDGAGALRRVELPDGSERLFHSIYGGPILNGAGGQHFWEEPQVPPSVRPRHERAVDATGATYAYETNPFGSRTLIEEPTGAETRFERNADNLPTTIELPDGAQLHNEYDDRGRPTRFEDPTGAVSRYVWDGPDGALSALEDPAGVRTEFGYDAAGHPERVVVAAGTAAERAWETSYDATGLTEWVRDPQGDEVHYVYDELGRCVSVTDALGRTVRFEYDAAGDTTAIEDPAGETWRLEYDEMGRITARENPLGHRRTYEYDLSGRATAIVDEVGARTELEYDAMGRVVTIRDALEREVHLAYDGEGNVVRAERPDGLFTYRYDAAHRLVRETRHHGDDGAAVDGDDVTVLYERDVRGQVVAVERGVAGQRWEYERDPNGRLVREIDPLGAVTEYAYDERDHLTHVVDPRGRTTEMTYDAFGLLRRIEDGDGLIAERSYDGEGRLVESVDADGGRVSFGHDAGGQLTSVVDELGAETTYVYDPRGLLERVVDPVGSERRYAYDAAGRRTTESDSLGRTTEFERDEAGRVVVLRDPEGSETSYDRDVLGRVRVMAYHDGSEERLAYDAAGRVVERVLPDDRVFRWEYDDRGWLVAEDAPEDALDATFTWYPNGLLEAAENGWSRVTFEWDEADRLVARTENGRRTSFRYDVAAGQTWITYPSGLEVMEELDRRGRLSQLRLDGSPGWIWRYDRRNNPTQRSGPGLQSRYDWTARGELERVEHGALFERTVGRDAAGRVTVEEDAVRPDRSWTYAYDAAGRLVRADRGELDGTGAIPAPLATFGYTYDDVSDLLVCDGPGGATTFECDALHRLTRAGDRDLVHDAAGNLVADGTWDYDYDARGRLLRVTWAADGAEVLAIGYNALGDRIVTRRGEETIEHVRLGDRVLEDYLTAGAGGGALLRRYVHGGSARELLQLEAGDERFFYLQDRLGSVVGLADRRGDLVERYAYAPYGAVERFDGEGAPLAASLVGNPFHFSAQPLDEPMGWLHFRFRSYAPDLRRFVSRDPAGYAAGGSLYVYARADPVNLVDPHGDFAPILLAGLVAANIAMHSYNAAHACGNPLDPASYQGTDWDGNEQLKIGIASGAAGMAGGWSFGAWSGMMSTVGAGAGTSYVTAGATSGIVGRAVEDLILQRQSTNEEAIEAALLGGVLGGAGHVVGKMASSLKLLNAIEGINPKAAMALADDVLNPNNTLSGFAGRVKESSQLLKNITRKQTVPGRPGPSGLAGDIDVVSDRFMTQPQRVAAADRINQQAGAQIVDAHETHGILSQFTPANLVVDETLTAVSGKLHFQVIRTIDLFRYGGTVVKPSTGELKKVAARPVLEMANPVPYLNALFQPAGTAAVGGP